MLTLKVQLLHNFLKSPLSVREKRSSSKEDVTNSSQPNICANVRGLDGRDGRDESPGPRGQPGRDGRNVRAGQQGPRGEPIFIMTATYSSGIYHLSHWNIRIGASPPPGVDHTTAISPGWTSWSM